MLGFGFFQTCIYTTKIFRTVWFISSIFMPNDSIEGAEVQEAPCSFSSRAERGMKFHGSQSACVPRSAQRLVLPTEATTSLVPPLWVMMEKKNMLQSTQHQCHYFETCWHLFSKLGAECAARVCSFLAGLWQSPLAGIGDTLHSAFQLPSAANMPKHGLSWDLSPILLTK